MSLEDAGDVESAVLASLGDAILVVAPDGTVTYQGPSVTTVLGYDADELVGSDAAELVHDEHRDDLAEMLDAAAPSDAERVDLRVRDADGEWRWTTVRISDPDAERLDGYVLEIRDVTDQVHARWETEELLDRMVEGFIALDRDWRVTHLNAHAAAVLEVDRDAAVGQKLIELFPGAEDSTFEEEYTAAFDTGEPRSFESYYEPLDAWFSVSLYPSATGLSVFFEDVSERKRTEMALAKNEKALRDLHDIAADKDLPFEEKLTRLLDLGRDRLDLALGFLTRIETEGDDGEGVQRVVACQGDHDLLVKGESCPLSDAYCRRTIEEESLMSTRDPVTEWVPEQAYETFGLETYVGGKLIVDGELYGTLCFADTERRDQPFGSDEEAFVELLVEWMAYELERHRREAKLQQQNERLEGFASMVSHDLRNPLTVAQGHLELAEEGGDPEDFQRVADSLDRMERLIDEMLWLAREGRDIGSLEAVDLSSVAREAWEYVATENADLEVACEECTIDADRDRLSQLLENLMRNAIDHTDGDVTVRVGPLATDDDGGDAGFYIEDDGPGIPEDERDRVFESGYTTDPDGTGFGLSIVERVADAHGWAVSVSEAESGGARFEFRTERP